MDCLLFPNYKTKIFENLQKQTQLLVNAKNIGFDVKQNIAFSMSEVIKKKKKKSGTEAQIEKYY